ncbi:hypothetical protein [Kitasatospora sp. NPDC057198]|uniref:hypothetical protein n=1 Tax=Kitasatospora sp. NPDC057198 TaxID=3346046 RepID=UPI0036279CBE
MTTIRRPADRDAVRTLQLLAAGVPLLITLPHLLYATEFSYAWATDCPESFGAVGQVLGLLALALTASALLTGLCLPVAGALVTRRQGLRIAPFVLLAGTPVTLLATFAPLLRN